MKWYKRGKEPSGFFENFFLKALQYHRTYIHDATYDIW